ncbi:ribosome maturation factor RimM [Miniphocaeibacter massiliensis]|uniref:ribosome maturation factor RimM n=1 Tax=Miniphocaeibacter massiliensis TaxID=2041841 RepID=UPI000C0790D4|nr:ribosome maturation factor RimM [Miniphocaeibacter massiliensis]
MELIKVGYITNTHGIKGDIKIYPLTDYPERFDEKIDFYIEDEKTKVKIKKTRLHRGLVYVKLEGYNNINEVLKFKDKYIYINEEDRLELPEDIYYISDLVGMEIIDGDKLIGVVKEVMSNQANDIYICEDKNKKEFMIPAVKEFIKNVDIKNGKIYTELIEGIIE